MRQNDYPPKPSKATYTVVDDGKRLKIESPTRTWFLPIPEGMSPRRIINEIALAEWKDDHEP